MLESSLAELANLFRAHDERSLADWVEHTVHGDSGRLPRRVLQMFTRGTGGLIDRPLYTDSQLDTGATEHRDALANQVYQQALARLG